VMVFHPAMAPYRIDLFNRLGRSLTSRFVFLRQTPKYDAHLDAASLATQLACDHAFLTAGRDIGVTELAWRAIAEMRRFRPDIVVTHEFRHASFVAAAWSFAHGGRPRHVVWSTKNDREVLEASGLRRVAMRRLLRGAAAVLCYSSVAADVLSDLSESPREKFFICANHQDPARLRALARESSATVLRECLKLQISSSRVAIVVARLAPEKNVDHAIAAFHQACADDCDSCLVVIGEGPLRPDLHAAALSGPARDRILFLGQRSAGEVQSWLAAASISILASGHEPFGAVVGESLIQGTPVLCSDAVGASSMIDHPSKGAVFPTGRVDALASLLTRYRAAFVPVTRAVAERKPSIPCATVEDDVSGFLSAISFASRGRHG
jgi:glycosyltransferase involved in cell wall biosynthesis